MGAGHGHGDAGGPAWGHSSAHASGRAEDRRRLWLVLAITAVVLVVEVVGALASGSLALLADAGHMLTDAGAVLLALGASYVARLPASPRRTFGYHRAEILAAGLNAAVLLVVCAYLAYAGVRRMLDPPDVDAGQMAVFAAVGLGANLLSLALLTSRREGSMNMRGAFLEVLSDAAGSAASVAAAVVILTTGWLRADPLVSLLIAALVLPRAVALLREAGAVLLESAPSAMDVEEFRGRLLATDGVVDVHDLHAWTITSGMPSLSAHVTVSEACLRERGVGRVLDDLARCAKSFGVEHTTFQVEPRSHRGHEHLGEADHA